MRLLAMLGLDRALNWILRRIMRRLVRFRTVPERPEQVTLDRGRLVCYALHMRQLSALLVLQDAAQRLGMPAPLSPLIGGPLKESSSFFFLTRSGQPSPLQRNPYRYSSRLERLVQAVREDSSLPVSIVPVSIFWGRAPDKQDSVLKALFADSWVAPGLLKQVLGLLIHGRHTFVKFGEPIALEAVVSRALIEDTQGRTAMRRVARLLRAEFRRERELAVGPNLSHRQTLISEVIRSAPVQAAIAEESQRGGVTLEQAELKARRQAYEIASDYSYPFIRAYDFGLTALWNRIYNGIEVHHFEVIAQVGAGAELVYLPCHRSHVDYLLLSYVIDHRGLLPPHVAAGANLNAPILGALLRRGGAFFLRRSFKGEPLFAAVFAEYLHTIIQRGFPIEYFLEGGRSRTGRMLPPKAGLLAMTVESYLRDPQRPVVFVPVYIGYEQLIEGETYVAELSGKPKKKESIFGALMALRELRRNFGKVHVNIGEPIRLSEFLDEHWPAWRTQPLQETESAQRPALTASIDRLADQVVRHINDAVVINPVSLIGVAILGAAHQAMDARRLAQQIDTLRDLLARVPYSARQVITELDGNGVIDYALRNGIVQRIAHPLGDIIQSPGNQAVLLGYFRNNVLHAFVLPALIACLIARNERIDGQRLLAIVRNVYRFLRAEFFLVREDAELEGCVNACLDAFRQLQLVRDSGPWLRAPLPNVVESITLHSLAQVIRPPLERYYIVLSTLARFGSGGLTARSLEDISFLLSQRLAFLHETAGPEFFDRGTFRSIVHDLIDIGLVTAGDGRLHFGEAMKTAAHDADYLLSTETRLAISHVSQLSETDIAAAEASLAPLKAAGPKS